jgi:hypothetical protein
MMRKEAYIAHITEELQNSAEQRDERRRCREAAEQQSSAEICKTAQSWKA